MNNLKLEIRAAKVLKWKFVPWDKNRSENLILHPLKGYYFHESNLEFTTSYDWAMLGLDAVNAKYYGLDEYLDKLVEILGWKGLKEYHYGENINHDDQVSKIVQAKPFQITQAWVEVLEKKEGKT